MIRKGPRPHPARHWRMGFALAAGGLLLTGLAAVFGSAEQTGRATNAPQAYDADLLVAIPYPAGYELRQVHFLLVVGNPADVEAEIRQVKDNFLASIPGSLELDEDGVGAAFAATGFVWPTGQGTWFYVDNDVHRPAGLVNHRQSIAAGASTWGSAGADFAFVDGGSTAQDNPPCTGYNAVGWAQLDVYGPTVLGVACTGYSGPTPVFDLNFDTDGSWSTDDSPSSGEIDLQSVSVHEFGHVAGLGHTQP
ncbi:MAG: matrixin family metalloprotease [Dehalococcoidia bacterium]